MIKYNINSQRQDYSPFSVALTYQHVPITINPIPIVIKQILSCIDFELSATAANTHLMHMLADTGAATNTGNITTCYFLLYYYINPSLSLFLCMLYVSRLTIDILLCVYYA